MNACKITDDIKAAMDAIRPRSASANSVPVERATVPAAEWAALESAIQLSEQKQAAALAEQLEMECIRRDQLIRHAENLQAHNAELQARIAELEAAQPCCGNWSSCTVPCVPRADHWQAEAHRIAEPEAQAAQSATLLPFSDALRIARGCTDYGGGYRCTEHYGAYQDGIKTVIASLEAAFRKGLSDPQVAALRAIGAQEEQAAPKPAQAPLTDEQMLKLVLPVTHMEARQALEDMDDFARMSRSVEPIGAYKTLLDYITSMEAAQAPKSAQVAAPAQIGGWQLIETAPRDGTVVLLGYAPHPRMVGSRRVYEGCWHEAQSTCTSVNGFLLHSGATHWMPLPAAPKQEGGEQ
jgi:hypothetical protein